MDCLRRVNVLSFRLLCQSCKSKSKAFQLQLKGEFANSSAIALKSSQETLPDMNSLAFIVKKGAKINNFLNHREQDRSNIKNPKEYLANMMEAIDPKSKSLVLIEDIRNIIALAETDEDLEILWKALLKFISQQHSQYIHFSFGTEVMRLYYVMNKPVEALRLVETPGLLKFFSFKTNALILMDLLFNNNMYNEIIEVYHYLEKNSKNILGSAFLTYYFAACYRLNTGWSLKQAKAHWSRLIQDQVSLPFDIRCFYSLLLLKQDECPVDAFKFRCKFNSLRENFRCMTLAKANRFDQLFTLFRELINIEEGKFLMSQEAVSFVEDHARNSSVDNFVKFYAIKEKMIERNIIIEEPLEVLILESKKMKWENDNDIYEN